MIGTEAIPVLLRSIEEPLGRRLMLQKQTSESSLCDDGVSRSIAPPGIQQRTATESGAPMTGRPERLFFRLAVFGLIASEAGVGKDN